MCINSKTIFSFFAAFLLIINVFSQSLPPDEKYVLIKEGHLFHNGKRIRFWGAVGSFPGKNHKENEAVVRRLKEMGFNMVRFWKAPEGDGKYTKGDGTRNDLIDHFLYTLQQEGIHVWYAALNRVGTAMPEDASIIKDVKTEAAWKKAIGEKGSNVRNHIARIWDPRLHRLGLERMKKISDHVNQYNGLRYADDLNIAIWELSNEEWWFGDVVSQVGTLPSFFQQELLEQWNAFLKKKYTTEENLKKAWLGLLPGESFKKSSIMLLPLKKAVEPDRQREALGVNITGGTGQKYSIDDFNRQRGADVIEFLVKIWLEHKQDEHNALKAWGKGIRLGSLCWDTGIGNEIQSQFLHQHADAITHCTYITGFHHDSLHRRFPWFSGLEELPRLSWDASWLEQNKMEGKPFFAYENQIHNPAKYRAEYPMRMASLAAIQDWDVMVWHYFGVVPAEGDDKPYVKPMDYSISGESHPQGLHFQYDEVQMSSMKAAAEIFRQGLLVPAPSPTKFIFGRKSLYDPRSMEYGASYGQKVKMFMPTTYRYGMRLYIDSTREDDEIIGPVYKERVYEINPIRPTHQIEYDWQRGHLMFDAPAVKMYTGFFAQYGGAVKFGNGIELKEVKMNNPPGIAYPVAEDEKYIEFALVSKDGKPLSETKEAMISLVSTSFNSGFKLNHQEIKKEFGWFFKENTKATESIGTLPVLVARAGAVINAPALEGMSYKMLDWQLKEIKTGTVKNGKLEIPAELPVFIVELKR